MKALSLIAFILNWTLVGCAIVEPGQHKAATLTVLAEVCNTYSSALRVLTPMRAAGKLSDSEIEQVNEANAVADEICLPGSVEPADPLDAVSKVNSKVVQLLAIRERAQD